MLKKLLTFVITTVVVVITTTIIIINNIQITNLTITESDKINNGMITITLFNNDYNYYFEIEK
jgi:hypothetical protein